MFTAGSPGPWATEVNVWANSVVANGGTVSAARVVLLNAYVAALKVAGVWTLIDDMWIPAAENSVSALTSVKQRRLATVTAAPTFTIDRDYTFNGTSNYINTGFIPGTHAVAMTGSDMRISAYERTNLAATATYSAGVNDATNQNLRVGARTAGNVVVGGADSAATNFGSGITNSQGLTALSRTAAGVFEIFKNGVSGGTATPGTTGTVLPIRSIGIGGIQNAGTFNTFRAASVAFVSVGASLSAAQELAAYNALQTYMTAVGANV